MKDVKPFAIALGIVVVLIAALMVLNPTTGYAITSATKGTGAIGGLLGGTGGTGGVGGGASGGTTGITLKCSNAACNLCTDQPTCSKKDCIWDSSISKCAQHAFDASAIATGVLNAAIIPTLDNLKGSLIASQLPNIDASKITTGVLNADRIPKSDIQFATFRASSLDSPSTNYKKMVGKTPNDVCKKVYNYKGAVSGSYTIIIPYYSSMAKCSESKAPMSDIARNDYIYAPTMAVFNDYSLICTGGNKGMSVIYPDSLSYVVNGLTDQRGYVMGGDLNYFKMESTISVICYK